VARGQPMPRARFSQENDFIDNYQALPLGWCILCNLILAGNGGVGARGGGRGGALGSEGVVRAGARVGGQARRVSASSGLVRVRGSGG